MSLLDDITPPPVSIGPRRDGLFSILIPSWNNLSYLRLCLESLRKNSSLAHQFIIIVNEGSDGSLDWARAQPDTDVIHARRNIGVCYALNACRRLIRADYVLYANDDMYFLPGWDSSLLAEINKIGHKGFMLSSTMIEPDGGNPCVVVADYGAEAASFRERELLAGYRSLIRPDWSGSVWPPNLMPLDLWDLVGGLSVEFSPGMYSDPDLARKLWLAGVRTFIGKGDSLVYHFGRKSTGRMKRNDGRSAFLLKWGISSKTFTERYLRRGRSAVSVLPETNLNPAERLRQFIKRLAACFKF